MTLLENWRNLAYGDGLDEKKKEELWSGYFTIEKGIYEQILANLTEVVEGKLLRNWLKYDTEVMIATGFWMESMRAERAMRTRSRPWMRIPRLRLRSTRRSYITTW